ncbi:ATP-binding protein [Paraliomyxa miuraensis]|uniref:ATP-binding protein n=1 Tax=Paraliomyxa miuraensis TaxID=376150 RepID=UPI0022565B6F|nr:ATP-binding protein [Paraliomyxa miuraensis]MCX4245265.1 ATP-binding protein [Paraliomyxa miuraensis]
MHPSFNIAGPCIRGEHYMLPPERRLDRVTELIDEHRYFTLHAGRQVGKTTSARWLVQRYNAGDRFCALWVDIQDARELPDPTRAFELVLDDLDRAVEVDLPGLALPSGPARALEPAHSSIRRYLQDLAARAPKPLVVLFDEADGVVGEAMVSFLTQLRQGYIARVARPFPASVVLVGQRQVRDYVLREEDRRAVAWLGTTSPFNINAEATTLVAFTEAEVGELLSQHTEATGQRFSPEAVTRIYELGQGHPWLTNALADQIVRRDAKDRSIEVTAAHVHAAKETIILERRTHIDSLMARLREDRVRRVLAPMLAGDAVESDVLDDDFSYVLGLGLVRDRGGRYELANPIYREVVPRALTHHQQRQIFNEPTWYVRPDGALDMPKLMADWQVFWRKDGHLAAEGFRYREAGPHLMLMAFLQRIVNGGGRIEREYGLGRGALDLVIEWQGQQHAIEVKLRRDTETEGEALDQVTGYLDHLGLPEGWLVMFDLRKGKRWDERLTTREVEHRGKRIHLIGC